MSMCHLDNVYVTELFDMFHVETQSKTKVIILIYQDMSSCVQYYFIYYTI